MNGKTKLPSGTRIVVADGGGARILRNAGEDGALALEQVELVDPAQLPLATPARSQPPELPGEEAEEAGFAKRLAQRLNEDALKHRYEHLVLLADPRTLGQMRPLLHKEVRARMIGEHAVNLVNSPIEDIARALG